MFPNQAIQALIVIKVEVAPSVHNGPIHGDVSNRRWLKLRHPLEELHAFVILFTKRILNLCLLDAHDVQNTVPGECLPLLGLSIALSHYRVLVLDLTYLRPRLRLVLQKLYQCLSLPYGK